MANDETNQERRFFLTAATTVVGGVGIAFGAVPFIASFQPSERTRAIGAPIEADISKIEPGQRLIFEWRGKPVWVVSRTPASIADLSSLDDILEDPSSEKPQQPDYAKNTHRSVKQEYLVVVGICTHLGCSPSFMPAGPDGGLGEDWKGGFFCPCHGSKFDLAGRVYARVPAPANLEVPQYQYLSDTLILIGADQEDS